MRFSERAGYRPVREAIQIEGMDAPLRNSLWNVYSENFAEHLAAPYTDSSMWLPLYRAIWRDFWKEPIESIPPETWRARQAIANWFDGANWYEVYDFVEFTISYVESPQGRAAFEAKYNSVLSREVAGYRVMAGLVTPITDEQELGAIQEAMTIVARKGPLAAVQAHLQAALAMLSNRTSPDYRNSIKESISAVEALARLIAGDEKAELGKALKKLESGIAIHPALRTAFAALYGYSSDESGIRHALGGQDAVGFEDAKYMLAVCSAFIHYLVIKAQRANVNLA